MERHAMSKKLPMPLIFATLFAVIFHGAGSVTAFDKGDQIPPHPGPLPRERETPNGHPTVIVVMGAPGLPEFGINFLQQAELWDHACKRAEAKTIRIGLDENAPHSDFEALQQTLAIEPKRGEPLWLVFIGHGTFDGKEARFNLRGPDVTPADIADWLKPFSRQLVFIDATSASAPFLNKLSGTNRVIVTATRSGNEQNFARFGQYFAEALDQPESDLDKDGQTSVLEGFLAASARVLEFYKTEGRLATEHALLDDNGDALGTPADWFRGVRPVKKPEGTLAVDGARAHQLALVQSAEEQKLPAEIKTKRDSIELQIARLRERKAQRPEAEYYEELEKLLSKLLDAYGKGSYLE
jgi:hypothetical protein